jgi:molecular chaperone DnaJ
MPADPYSVLGVSKGASADDIKKAYRKLAHQYHPDKKGGNEAKFKEVNEAYQTLSDPDKKARYDRFGHAGEGFGGGSQGFGGFDFGGGSGGFESIFDMFTGGFASSGAQRRATKGEDLHLEVGVSSADLGKRKVYEFQAFNACDTCEGSGVAPGSRMKECAICKGQGKVHQAVRTPFGTFAQVNVCTNCEGEGQIPEKKCTSCGGAGRRKGKRTLEIHIPKEISDRYLIAFPKEGNVGLVGDPPGDLLITVRMQ